MKLNEIKGSNIEANYSILIGENILKHFTKKNKNPLPESEENWQ